MGALTKLMLAPALFLVLTAGMCSTTGGLCDSAGAIRPTAAEIEMMSDETRREILAHNKTLQAECGAQP